jgi:hypothetical protein
MAHNQKAAWKAKRDVSPMISSSEDVYLVTILNSGTTE